LIVALPAQLKLIQNRHYSRKVIAYAPYVETIDGMKLSFHAKACAEAYKKANK
jgi:D-aminopeptidase